MVKRELVGALSKAFPGLAKRDMGAFIDVLFESLALALTEGDTVEVRGVGRFKIRERRPMEGRNPKTKISVYVPSRWVVHFRPAESFIRRINQSVP